MTNESFKRKLTAILSADVEGYSRLMGEDEDATIRTLTTYRELMSTLIEKHRGRVVDSPGDNLLAEFGSVVDAVRCAVEIQEELRVRNAELSENRRMHFRIGINLGDVVEEGERIYGDGVNITARVEGLAEGGGICISGTVYDSIKNKLSLSYKSLGEHTVKNITEPVRVYRMRVGPVVGEEKAGPRRWQKAALAAVVVLVVAAGAWAIWNFYFRPPPIEPASVEKMALPLPDKPSIAVLPFDNLSGDPEQEFFSDGITEEIITSLSKVPPLFVIARTSTFTYKGKPVKVRQVAEELGVRYVLEGSVRKAGDRIRITAQLIDAIKGHHLWAERYDRDLKDIFAIQDEITLKICNALQMELTSGEQARLWHRGTINLEAWGCIVKGNALFVRFAKGDNAKARDLYERAVEIDPKDAFAWTMLAWTHWVDAFLGYSESRADSFKRAVELAKKALSMDDTLSDVYALLGGISLFQRQYEKAIAAGEKSIALGPSSATSHVLFGYTMSYAGRFEEAIALIKKGMRLTPHCPAFYLNHLGRPYFQTGRYEEALATYKQLLERSRKGEFNPFPVHLNLAATYIMVGREEEARAHTAEVLRINPNFSLEWVHKVSPYKDPAHLQRILDALRKAGIPDKPPLPLPDKPSIAVLPFTNISGDPEQEYFTDGMTDDLITDLSKISGLFVIARNSVFTYKGKSVKVEQIGRELGVRYILEGSVRRADKQVRINAQLIDAKTGGHLWAERYDGKMDNIFTLQDKITGKIVTALAVKLTASEQENVARRGTDNVAAYDAFLQGREYYLQHTRDDMVKAVTYLKRAIELDPNFSSAHAALSGTYNTSRARRWDKDLGWTDCRALSEKHLQLAMRNPTPKVHRVAALHYMWKGQHEKAIAEAERALTLEPNNDKSHVVMGAVLIYAGRSKEAIEVWKKAMRLDPYYPARYLWFLGLAQFCVGQLQEAATTFERAHKRNPGLAAWPLAATYAHLGREQEAADLIAEYLKRRGWKTRTVKSLLPYYPFKDPKDTDRFAEGLRKAGLPD